MDSGCAGRDVKSCYGKISRGAAESAEGKNLFIVSECAGRDVKSCLEKFIAGMARSYRYCVFSWFPGVPEQPSGV
jgi:hypothetical protein